MCYKRRTDRCTLTMLGRPWSSEDTTLWSLPSGSSGMLNIPVVDDSIHLQFQINAFRGGASREEMEQQWEESQTCPQEQRAGHGLSLMQTNTVCL